MIKMIMCIATLCGANFSYADDFMTWDDLRYQRVVRQQFDTSCGIASLATLLNRVQPGHYYDEDQLLEHFSSSRTSEQLYNTVTNGFRMVDLYLLAEEAGFVAQGRSELSFAQLERLGLYALLYLEDEDLQHFVVFDGVVGDQVLISDPKVGHRRIGVEQFIKIWRGDALFVKQRNVDALPVVDVHETQNSAKQQMIRTVLQ